MKKSIQRSFTRILFARSSLWLLLLLIPFDLADRENYLTTASPQKRMPLKMSKEEMEQLQWLLKKEQLVAELRWKFRQAKYNGISSLLKALDETAPLSGELFYFKALYYDHKGDEERAQAAVDIALKREPKLAYAWDFQGLLYVKGKNLEAASQSFWRATLLNPYEPDYFYNYADSLYQLGKKENSLIAVKNAIYLKPNFDKAYYLLALLQKEKGNLNASLNAFQKAKAAGICHPSFLPDYAQAAKIAGKNEIAGKIKKEIESGNSQANCDDKLKEKEELKSKGKGEIDKGKNRRKRERKEGKKKRIDKKRKSVPEKKPWYQFFRWN